jgi:hypothetical protein
MMSENNKTNEMQFLGSVQPNNNFGTVETVEKVEEVEEVEKVEEVEEVEKVQFEDPKIEESQSLFSQTSTVLLSQSSNENLNEEDKPCQFDLDDIDDVDFVTGDLFYEMVSYCCFCGEMCNPCSQACSSCLRDTFFKPNKYFTKVLKDFSTFESV